MNGNMDEFVWPIQIEDYSVRCPLNVIGGGFYSYIGFDETENWLTEHAGIRLVLIPKNMKNNNIAIKKIRYSK